MHATMLNTHGQSGLILHGSAANSGHAICQKHAENYDAHPHPGTRTRLSFTESSPSRSILTRLGAAFEPSNAYKQAEESDIGQEADRRLPLPRSFPAYRT